MTLNHLLPHGVKVHWYHRLQLWLTSGRASGRKTRAKTKFMRLIRQQASKAAIAFPVGDAQGIRLNPVRSGQGLLGHERAQVKKLVRVRVGTLNVGTMTGRGRELADMMERRKVVVLCVQETRWKGDKAKELGGGCKLLRSGANKQGRNGVGIVISKDLKEDLISVSKRSDRVMSIKLGVEETVVNIICAYAPKVCCTEGGGEKRFGNRWIKSCVRHWMMKE